METSGEIVLRTFVLGVVAITVVMGLIHFFFGLGQGIAERMVNGKGERGVGEESTRK